MYNHSKWFSHILKLDYANYCGRRRGTQYSKTLDPLKWTHEVVSKTVSKFKGEFKKLTIMKADMTMPFRDVVRINTSEQRC